MNSSSGDEDLATMSKEEEQEEEKQKLFRVLELVSGEAAALKQQQQQQQIHLTDKDLSARDFIHFEAGGNVWAAAYRWSAYWKERVALFGKNSNNQNGNIGRTPLLDLSQMSRDETTILVSGMITPDANHTVLHVDLSKQPPTTACKDALAKNLFFWMHYMAVAAARSTTSSRQGSHSNQESRNQRGFSIVISQQDFLSLEVSVIHHLYCMLCRTFPVHLKALHLVDTDAAGPLTPQYEQIRVQLSALLSNIVVLHSNTASLEQRVPPALGTAAFTDWLHANGVPWLDQNAVLEEEQEDDSKPSATDEINTGNDSKPPSYSESYVSMTKHDMDDDSQTFVCPTPVAVTNGDDISFVETSTIQNEGQKQIEDAIEAMDPKEKAAFLQALKVAPHLVEHETPPLWFLQFERYDAWAAAKRLVSYWKQRSEVFGERAFLPMSQTGYGTLSPEDVEVLRTGYLVILPRTASGQAALCYDASRLKIDDQRIRQIRFRCFFYFVSVLMEEQIDRSDGFHIVGILNDITIARSFGLSAQSRLFDASIPMAARQLHAVRCQNFNLSLFRRALPQLFQHSRKAAKKVTFHLGDQEEIRQSLETAGFLMSNLPTRIGGTWGYDQFTQWCEERCQFEMERYPSMRPSHLPLAGTMEEIVSEQDLAQSALDAFMNAQARRESADRRRKLRVIYSRQKRKRQKDKLNELHEKVFNLRNLQTSLRAENQRLDRLRQSAHELVQSFGFAAASAGSRLSESMTLHPATLVGGGFPLLINARPSPALPLLIPISMIGRTDRKQPPSTDSTR
eukprot:scaffold118_cov185-Amphora_coffeaeformis.AAC.2